MKLDYLRFNEAQLRPVLCQIEHQLRIGNFEAAHHVVSEAELTMGEQLQRQSLTLDDSVISLFEHFQDELGMDPGSANRLANQLSKHQIVTIGDLLHTPSEHLLLMSGIGDKGQNFVVPCGRSLHRVFQTTPIAWPATLSTVKTLWHGWGRLAFQKSSTFGVPRGGLVFRVEPQSRAAPFHFGWPAR